MSNQDNNDWLNKFVTEKPEEPAKPEVSQESIARAEDNADAARLKHMEELERMKSAAASGPFSGIAGGVGKVDVDKYLDMCDKFTGIGFTCYAPEGWEEAYEKHMQEKLAKFGSGRADAHVKPIGKKRHF